MPIDPQVYKKIVTAKLYIDRSFNEPLDLDRLSKEACLSRYHFHRLFTRIYRVTPHQYLTRKRIEHATRSLAARTHSVTEICNDVGFESIGSFSTLFKKEIGQTPTGYRHLAWQKEEKVREQPRAFIPHCFIDVLQGKPMDEPTKSNSQETGPQPGC